MSGAALLARGRGTSRGFEEESHNMPERPLNRKVVIITGGAGGMGTVMALALLEDGARVAVVDKQEERVRAMARSAAGLADEGSLVTLAGDITEAEDCGRVVRTALDRFGRVDALVNAAGIGMQTVSPDYMSRPVRFWEVDPDRWQAVMDVNWKGAFLMARAVTPHLVEQGSGRIVNVTTSLDTMFRGAYTPYGMSKAALEAASASWAADLEGAGVTVNVLVPGGPTNTSFIPGNAPFDRSRLVQPEVMAAPIRWLVSDASRGVTGCRFVGVDWDTTLAPDEAAKAACRPAAWRDLASQAVWPDRK